MNAKNVIKDSKLMDGWHLKKEVHIAHIITVLMVIFSIIWWESNQEVNMAKLVANDNRIEQKVDIQNNNVQKMLSRADRDRDKMQDMLKEIYRLLSEKQDR